MNSIVKINNLNITVARNLSILKNINLELPLGQTIGFIGPSGAGKTTLIRAIVGSLKISSGEIFVLGQKAGSKELRHKVSYMTQELSIYSDLTVKENLIYFITMMGVSKSEREKTLHKLLSRVDLSDKANVLVNNLSSGQKQRVSLAIALIGSPELIVLDEPTVGLDPVLRQKLWLLFNDLSRQGSTLIISSHSMDEASKCDYLVLVRDGKIIAAETPTELLRRTSSKTVEESFLKLVGDKE